MEGVKKNQEKKRGDVVFGRSFRKDEHLTRKKMNVAKKNWETGGEEEKMTQDHFRGEGVTAKRI